MGILLAAKVLQSREFTNDLSSILVMGVITALALKIWQALVMGSFSPCMTRSIFPHNWLIAWVQLWALPFNSCQCVFQLLRVPLCLISMFQKHGMMMTVSYMLSLVLSRTE